jgi:16S rRNA (cytidine1402-2'-O)-methyltransferase
MQLVALQGWIGKVKATINPFTGFKTSFFQKFAAAGKLRIFSRAVSAATGNFKKHFLSAMAVLLHQHQIALGRDWNHIDPVGKVHHVVLGHYAFVGKLTFVDPEPEKAGAINILGFKNFPMRHDYGSDHSMSLFVVATPIGNPGDITQRALDVLKSADLIIGEELKELRQILKSAGVQARAMDQLNEHSDAKDIEHFVIECRSKQVALVSDCGTPGFCDPGADLVKACRDAGIQVSGVPGASSLMTLLSVAGVRVDQFLFAGFLPVKAEQRQEQLNKLARESRPIVLMETPYRAEKFVQEIGKRFPDRLCILGLNLTQENEQVIRTKGKDLHKHGPYADMEPILLIT